MTTTWRAPGRVNLIGEHTDYNDGFVAPLALPLGVTAAVRAIPDGMVRARTTGAGDPAEFALAGLAPGGVTGWAAYVAGVVWALTTNGHPITGAEIDLDGDVPLGAGLSSSAALECAVATALDDAFGLGLSREELVLVARRAENDYVGVPSGSLDQSASMLCEQGHVLLLDTRSGERRQVPFDLAAAGLVLLVVDTRAPHQLVDGEYAARRRDCEEAARLLGVPALRDVGLDALDRLADDRLRRRVRHVVTENARVLSVMGVLDSGGDPREIGPMLTASHESLRDDYEVSCAELDTAVAAALAAGAYGARMTGGGFGGSAIALVEVPEVDPVSAAVAAAFAERSFAAPSIFLAVPSAGAHRV